MLPQERYTKIKEHLDEHLVIKIDQLMEMFDISIETARRDLNHLEKEGVLKKIYGGATLVTKESREPATSERMVRNLAEKIRIGEKCAEFVNDGETVLIEVGTTTLQVAKALKKKRNLKIITNSLYVINELINTDFDLYIIGGKLRHDEGAISGAVSMLGLENFNISKSIIGAGGVNPDNGISDYQIEEAMTRKKVIEQSKEVILVADNSKFGKDVLVHICPIEDIDIVITGDELESQIIEAFDEKRIKLVLA